jgi:hypothetical protein
VDTDLVGTKWLPIKREKIEKSRVSNSQMIRFLLELGNPSWKTENKAFFWQKIEFLQFFSFSGKK